MSPLPQRLCTRRPSFALCTSPTTDTATARLYGTNPAYSAPCRPLLLTPAPCIFFFMHVFHWTLAIPYLYTGWGPWRCRSDPVAIGRIAADRVATTSPSLQEAIPHLQAYDRLLEKPLSLVTACHTASILSPLSSYPNVCSDLWSMCAVSLHYTPFVNSYQAKAKFQELYLNNVIRHDGIHKITVQQKVQSFPTSLVPNFRIVTAPAYLHRMEVHTW